MSSGASTHKSPSGNGNSSSSSPDKNGAEEDSKTSAVRLPRVLSFWDISAYFICTVIGSGIFVSPKRVLEHSGSPGMAMIMWLVTGGYNLLISLCYAELSLTFPKAGGDYAYIQEGFGEL